MKKRLNTKCPIVYSLDIWGDPWSLVILRDVLLRGKRHYREFLNSEEHIATNILSSRLQSLAQAGLLSRKTSVVNGITNRAQTMYEPTQKAYDLLPAIVAIMRWGIKYNQYTDMSAELVQQVIADPEAVQRRFMRQL